MSETALLLAVRDKLREAGYRPDQCDIEISVDVIPPSVGDLYLMVIPGGYHATDTHNTSGGVVDEVYEVDVAIIMRETSSPRDRSRKMLIDMLGSFNAEIKKIKGAIDFQYEVLNAANAIIALEDDSGGQGFEVPLRFVSVDPRPTPVPGEWFAGNKQEPRAGLMRVVHFGGAQRRQVRT